VNESDAVGLLTTGQEVGVGLIVGGAALFFGGIFLAGGLGAGLGLITGETGAADALGFGSAIAGGVASGIGGAVTTISSIF
jgi:hypothetical protein